MLKNNQQLLEFLTSELKCIETGNYGYFQPQPWRARLAFEDSPCCPNYANRDGRVSCDQCTLIDFVPQDRRNEKAPCRFIPLNANGETIDSLYRCGTQQELETALAQWLRRSIHQIEDNVAKPHGGGS